MDKSLEKTIESLTHESFLMKSENPENDHPITLIFIDVKNNSYLYKIDPVEDKESIRQDGTWTDTGKIKRDTAIRTFLYLHQLRALNISRIEREQAFMSLFQDLETHIRCSLMNVLNHIPYDKPVPKTKLIALRADVFIHPKQKNIGAKSEALMTLYRTNNNAYGCHYLYYVCVNNGVMITGEKEKSWSAKNMDMEGRLMDILKTYLFTAEGLGAREFIEECKKKIKRQEMTKHRK